MQQNANQRDWQDMRRILERRKMNLLQNIEGYQAVAEEQFQPQPYPPDPGDNIDLGTNASDQDRSMATLELERQELRGVEEALRRMESGNYGVCEECGNEISYERLKLVPETRFCVQCKKAKESEIALRRRQFSDA